MLKQFQEDFEEIISWLMAKACTNVLMGEWKFFFNENSIVLNQLKSDMIPLMLREINVKSWIPRDMIQIHNDYHEVWLNDIWYLC
jgi:hypothetical protein